MLLALVAASALLSTAGSVAPCSAKTLEAKLGMSGWIIPPGQEAKIRRALEPKGAEAGWALQEALVDRDRVRVRFGPKRQGETTLSVSLLHPSQASEGSPGSKHMVVVDVPGPAPADGVAMLAERVKAAGSLLAVWQYIEPEPELPQHQRPEPERPAAEVAAEAAAVGATMARVREAFSRGNEAEVLTLLGTLDVAKIADGGVRLEMALTYARLDQEQALIAISRTFPEDPALGEQALFGPALRAELPDAEALFAEKSDEEICLFYRIGDILSQIGRTGPATELLDAILTRVPGCARAAETLGLMYIDHRQGDRAIEVLRDHHRTNPSDMRLTLALSHAYRMTGELEEAIRLFHTTAEALAFDEDNQYLGQLLALYLTSSTVEQWVDHWREVLTWNPDHVTGRFLLGACLHYLDEFEASNVHLEKLVGVIDHEPRIYVYQAMNHFNLGDRDKARAFLEQGIALKKVDPDVYYCRAEITRDTERDLAISDLERYLTLTARSQYENPKKRRRVEVMRDALVRCKAEGTPVCEAPWEHPRSKLVGFFRRHEASLFGLGALLLLGLMGAAIRRRRTRAEA